MIQSEQLHQETKVANCYSQFVRIRKSSALLLFLEGVAIKLHEQKMPNAIRCKVLFHLQYSNQHQTTTNLFIRFKCKLNPSAFESFGILHSLGLVAIVMPTKNYPKLLEIFQHLPNTTNEYQNPKLPKGTKNNQKPIKNLPTMRLCPSPTPSTTASLQAAFAARRPLPSCSHGSPRASSRGMTFK